MVYELRKLVTVVEELHTEAGRSVSPPLRVAIAAAVLRNPWLDRGFVDDLSTDVKKIGPKLGQSLSSAVVTALGGGANVEAYGKSAIVGLSGELEHASALIHSLHFGNVFRDMAEGSSFLRFTNRRTSAGDDIVIPLGHKHDDWRRSHYMTVDTCIKDAPRTDEIVVALAAATGGRPFARIGDRNQEIAAGV